MMSGKRIVVILLLFAAAVLVCSWWRPDSQAPAINEDPVAESSIRVNPLSIQNESSAHVNPARSHPVSPPSVSSDGISGQHNLELDQAGSLYVRMYRDEAFLHEQYSFDPSEKVFLLMEFNQLKAGDHYLSALWKAPDGKLINTSRHRISLTMPSRQYRSFFWLKLIKNGAITELITGDEYKGEIHGKWAVEVHLDGVELLTQHFMINN